MIKLTRPHLLFFLLILFVSLACYGPWAAPSRPTPAPSKSSITAVTTEVFAGGNVHTQIKYIRGQEDQAALTCDYPDGNGGTSQYTYVDPDKDNPGTVTSFDFTLKKNGAYQVTCRMGSSARSANFTINEPEPSQPAAAESTKHKPGEITSASLVLVLDKATSTIPGLMPHHCTPEVHIAADGALTGSCSVPMYGGSEMNTGTLTGMWNGDTGEVTFRLETTSIYTNKTSSQGVEITGQTTWGIVFNAKGSVTSELQATGTAEWSAECASSNTEAVICSDSQKDSLKAAGAVPWLLNFNP